MGVSGRSAATALVERKHRQSMAREVAGPVTEVPGRDGAARAVNQNDGRVASGAPRHRNGAGERNGSVLECHVLAHVILETRSLASRGPTLTPCERADVAASVQVNVGANRHGVVDAEARPGEERGIRQPVEDAPTPGLRVEEGEPAV